MTPQERDAFVEAYSRNVAMINKKYVAEFVTRHLAGEDVEYSNDYASIMDALLMWHDAIKWQLKQGAKA